MDAPADINAIAALNQIAPDRGIGDNNPPSVIDGAIAIASDANNWILTSPEIGDADKARQANDFVEKLRAAKKNLADAMKSDLAPLEQDIKAVKGLYAEPVASVEREMASLIRMSGVWLQKERVRIAAEKAAQEAEARRLREEADRLKREAEEAARVIAVDAQEAELAARAAADASEAARTAKAAERVADRKPQTAAIKGTSAARAMTLRTYWSAVVVDETAAIESYRDHPTVRKAALAAALQVANEVARTLKDETKAPAGFRFVKDERAM